MSKEDVKILSDEVLIDYAKRYEETDAFTHKHNMKDFKFTEDQIEGYNLVKAELEARNVTY